VDDGRDDGEATMPGPESRFTDTARGRPLRNCCLMRGMDRLGEGIGVGPCLVVSGWANDGSNGDLGCLG
jgi:hypothetical protein